MAGLSESEAQLEVNYPLHYLVWKGDNADLKRHLMLHSYGADKPDLEKRDVRGRTPLMLAVTLGHKQCALTLLNHQARVDAKDASGFDVLDQAVSSKDAELVAALMQKKTFQSLSSFVQSLPRLVQQLDNAADFYVELKVNFSTWVPFLSGACPSDSYKIYKRGTKVRIDTTLVELDGSGRLPKWFRGPRSYIFSASENAITFLEIDHTEKWIKRDTHHVMSPFAMARAAKPNEQQIVSRLSRPVTACSINMDQVTVAKCKSGLFSFAQTDRVESICGYRCKVFVAKEIELAVKHRLEHLSTTEKAKFNADNSKLNKILPWIGVKVENIAPSNSDASQPTLANQLTLLEYFKPPPEQPASSSSPQSANVDIGISREMSSYMKRFRAKFWLSNEYPLSLNGQVLPIVDLLIHQFPHLQHLRHFITAKMPERGFPVKIDIPMFSFLGCTITFENVFATKKSVSGVELFRESNIDKCLVDEECFYEPKGYIYLPTTA